MARCGLEEIRLCPVALGGLREDPGTEDPPPPRRPGAELEQGIALGLLSEEERDAYRALFRRTACASEDRSPSVLPGSTCIWSAGASPQERRLNAESNLKDGGDRPPVPGRGGGLPRPGCTATACERSPGRLEPGAPSDSTTTSPAARSSTSSPHGAGALADGVTSPSPPGAATTPQGPRPQPYSTTARAL